MTKLVKPDYTVRWAALGDNTKPLDSYINRGWLAVKPPRQYFNWLDNRQDNMLAYINQSGIPEWDDTTEYEGGFSYVQGSDNEVYRCLADNTDKDPTAQPANAAFWEVAFGTHAEAVQNTSDIADLRDDYEVGAGITDPASFRTALSVYSKAEVDSVLPAGMVQTFALNVAPTGWLECNGTEISRATYANLFTAIGVSFGTGDGVTTFDLPDLRGEFVRGWDHGRGVDAGRAFSSGQNDAFQGHLHSLSGRDGAPSNVAWSNPASDKQPDAGRSGPAYDDGVHGTPRIALETRPRNIALMYCIKT